MLKHKRVDTEAELRRFLDQETPEGFGVMVSGNLRSKKGDVEVSIAESWPDDWREPKLLATIVVESSLWSHVFDCLRKEGEKSKCQKKRTA